MRSAFELLLPGHIVPAARIGGPAGRELMATTAEAFQPKFTNLVDLLQTAVKEFGPRPLFGTLRNGDVEWTTYQKFGKLVDAFRGGLASLGIGRGDRVAVISNNR